MTSDCEQLGPCRVKLTIEAPAEAIDPIFKNIRAAYTKETRLPGFRPGKAPWERIRQLYGESIDRRVNDEAIQALLKAAGEQLKREVYCAVNVENLRAEPRKGASATLTLDLEPTVETPDPAAWKVAKPAAEVTDAELDGQMEQARKQGVTFRDAAEGDVAAEGDLLGFAFASDLDPAAEPETVKPFLSSEEYWTQVSPGDDHFLPGLGAALLGKKLGETATLDVAFPEDFHVKALAGRTVHYTLTPKSMRKATHLEGEALAKHYGLPDLDALRARIRENLAAAKAAQARSAAAQALREKIDGTLAFDLPEARLDRETYEYLAMDPEKPLEQFRGKPDELRQSPAYAKAKDEATKALRRRYALLKLADARGRKLSEKEFNDALDALAGRVGKGRRETLDVLVRNGRLGDFSETELVNRLFADLIDECAVL